MSVLRLAYLNVRGWRGAAAGLTAHFAQQKIDICCVTETGRPRQHELLPISADWVTHTVSDGEEVPEGAPATLGSGLALMHSPSQSLLTTAPLDPHPDVQWAILTPIVAGGKPDLVLGSVYSPPRRKLRAHDAGTGLSFETFLRYLADCIRHLRASGHPRVIILGDFNSHLGADMGFHTCQARSCSRGRLLSQILLDDHDLRMQLVTGSDNYPAAVPTWRGLARGRPVWSVVDHVLCTGTALPLIQSVEAIEQVAGSDHALLSVQLRWPRADAGSLVQSLPHRAPRLTTTRMQDDYRKLLGARLPVAPTSCADVEQALAQTAGLVPTGTSGLPGLRKQLKASWLRAVAALQAAHGQDHAEARRLVRQTGKDYHHMSCAALNRAIRIAGKAQDYQSVWQLIRTAAGVEPANRPRPTVVVRDATGRLTSSARQAATALASHYEFEFEFEECIVAVHASTSPSHHSLAPCVVLGAASPRASKCVRGWRYMAVSSLHTQVRLTCGVCTNTSQRQGVSCWRQHGRPW